eukprot:COSAG01_NODE_29791_length_629_cov_1.798113_1_plen_167_part_10
MITEAYLAELREHFKSDPSYDFNSVENILKASNVRDPARQLGAQLITEGGGTGTFFHALDRIYGKYYYKIEKKSDIYDKFNAKLYETLFVELDEVIFAGNHEQANLMKVLTTEPKGTKEEKYGEKRLNQKRWFNIGAPGNTFHLNKTESDGRRDFYVTASEKHTGAP